MYKVFDPFLAADTWHTSHPLDSERFYVALAQLVRNAEFSPDEMRDYMFRQTGVDPDNPEDSRVQAIDERTHEAWAIREFLEVTGW